MLDPIDYKEPACPFCTDFYAPNDGPQGTIPIRSVIEKADGYFNKNDLESAEKLFDYWLAEARSLKDKRGELSVLSEQMGLYRKTGNKEKGMAVSREGLALIDELHLTDTLSGATVALNAATTMKAFGNAEESIPIYNYVTEIYDKLLSGNDLKKAGLYNNMALAYEDIGFPEEAEKYYKDALSILFKNEKTENEAAITYINMAHMYEKKDVFDERIYECMEKAKEMLDSPEIERNGYHAFVCSKCAPSFEKFGYFVVKEELEKRIEEIYERA